MNVGLRFQRFLGWLVHLPLSVIFTLLIRYRGRYRILNHQSIRERFREITDAQKPLIVCANHLTLIDSVVLIWALGSPLRYFLKYRLFSWNFPAFENVKKHLSWRLITYLTKCISVDRMGESSHTTGVLETICSLLRRGEVVMLFPEGTRSRSGRINPERVSYGVGKILQRIPDCQVLCAYLRGIGQDSFSNFPKRGETFALTLEVFQPRTESQGMRGARDLATQVIKKLEIMEQTLFSK